MTACFWRSALYLKCLDDVPWHEKVRILAKNFDNYCCQNRITFSIPNSMQDARSLIHQAHTENWEELDLSGMDLTELLPEIACLTGLRSLILGKPSNIQG